MLRWSISCVALAYIVAFGEASIIPESFTYSDLSQYTVRYLSEGGSDGDRCLENQYFPAAQNSTVQYCRTFQFALTGSYNNSSAECINRVVVLIRSGSYTFGPIGTVIYHSDHVILSRMPGEEGEVVLSCNSLDELNYNNLYYYNSSYIALKDVILTSCGERSTALAIHSVRNLVIANVTFR